MAHKNGSFFILSETTSCNDLASERGNVSREARVVERVNPHHEVELLYRNITLIRRLMNDGPSSVRVPRLNLIRALNLPGREHGGIPCRSRCVRQRLPSVAVTAGKVEIKPNHRRRSTSHSRFSAGASVSGNYTWAELVIRRRERLCHRTG
ncbi:hypothetical protein ALC57_17562 [Trachymyrmex cornetzi]|uniref:Uncharacterized protein n=1 Tax=Trachymyrmex cornetzi TaxID=471704 RepID=A0A195DBT3_9HYME|nr:hypothetical protein ALC57_17562 [Trachymyrmex cornetzi]